MLENASLKSVFTAIYHFNKQIHEFIHQTVVNSVMGKEIAISNALVTFYFAFKAKRLMPAQHLGRPQTTKLREVFFDGKMI